MNRALIQFHQLAMPDIVHFEKYQMELFSLILVALKIVFNNVKGFRETKIYIYILRSLNRVKD